MSRLGRPSLPSSMAFSPGEAGASCYLPAMPRPTPLDLIFSRIATTEFPAIRKAVEEAGIDPTNRDAFLLLPDVVTLMRELRPEDGIGEGMDFLIALGHHAYLTWEAGSLTVPLGTAQGEALLSTGSPVVPPLHEAPKAYYAQFLEHRIWATVVDEQVAEPLDGCFVHSTGSGALRVLGIFGLRPERLGFSAVEATGLRPEAIERSDGSALFASALGPARLHSIASADELLELGWRTLGPAREAWARAA